MSFLDKTVELDCEASVCIVFKYNFVELHMQATVSLLNLEVTFGKEGSAGGVDTEWVC